MKRLMTFAFLISGIIFGVAFQASAQEVPPAIPSPSPIAEPAVSAPQPSPSPATKPASPNRCHEPEFQAELRNIKPQKEIFYRLMKCMFAEQPKRYFFPVPRKEKYPPDILELSTAIPSITEIVLLEDGLLFRGNFRDWELMARVIGDKLNQTIGHNGYRAIFNPQMVDCTLSTATCSAITLPGTQVAKEDH